MSTFRFYAVTAVRFRVSVQKPVFIKLNNVNLQTGGGGSAVNHSGMLLRESLLSIGLPTFQIALTGPENLEGHIQMCHYNLPPALFSLFNPRWGNFNTQPVASYHSCWLGPRVTRGLGWFFADSRVGIQGKHPNLGFNSKLTTRQQHVLVVEKTNNVLGWV